MFKFIAIPKNFRLSKAKQKKYKISLKHAKIAAKRADYREKSFLHYRLRLIVYLFSGKIL